MKISELILMLQALDHPDAEIKVSLPTDIYDMIEEFSIVGLLDPMNGRKDWSVLAKRPGKKIHDESLFDMDNPIHNFALRLQRIEDKIDELYKYQVDIEHRLKVRRAMGEAGGGKVIVSPEGPTVSVPYTEGAYVPVTEEDKAIIDES